MLVLIQHLLAATNHVLDGGSITFLDAASESIRAELVGDKLVPVGACFLRVEWCGSISCRGLSVACGWRATYDRL